MSRRIKIRLQAIGLVVKHHNPGAAAIAESIALQALARGLEVRMPDESAGIVRSIQKRVKVFKNKIKTVNKSRLSEAVDLIVVFGGDGTFLSIARLMKNRTVPVVGVNMGQLGFLTEVRKEEASDYVESIFRKPEVIVSERALFEVILRRKNKTIFSGPVVNDAVISKGAIARIIGMQILIDGKPAYRVRADGIILSTPTGSTAYSLAAGGPILEPSLPAMVLSPICPHSLTQRPIVISDRMEVRICLDDRPGNVLLTLDGQDVVDMKEGDMVIFRKYQRHALLVVESPTRDYFSVLREKLKFGMREQS